MGNQLLERVGWDRGVGAMDGSGEVQRQGAVTRAGFEDLEWGAIVMSACVDVQVEERDDEVGVGGVDLLKPRSVKIVPRQKAMCKTS